MDFMIALEEEEEEEEEVKERKCWSWGGGGGGVSVERKSVEWEKAKEVKCSVQRPITACFIRFFFCWEGGDALALWWCGPINKHIYIYNINFSFLVGDFLVNQFSSLKTNIIIIIILVI
jgi:hypothetical protein